MRHQIPAWLGLVTLLWALAVSAADLNDEFTVPLQASAVPARSLGHQAQRTRTIKDKLTQGPALQAATAQTAIVAATGQHTAGCRLIRFKTGFGWVATGVAQYPSSENPVALRRSQQDARFKAFTEAITQLVNCIEALNPSARQQVTAALEQNDAIRLALINLAFTEADKQLQALKILTRGFITYSVEENLDQRTIYVNLVATPKTAARLTRPAADSVEAASLQEGLRQVHAEIGAGLIPPAGHRLIIVNTTGELALVGYAINLIGSHPDAAAQQKLRIDAEKMAVNRATDALMGLASGDEAGWQKSLDESTRTALQTVNSAYLDSEPSVIRFAQIRDFIMTSLKEDAGLEALRAGRLPSAVIIKRVSSENAVTAAAIYVPPIKKQETKVTPRTASQAPTQTAPATTAPTTPSSAKATSAPSKAAETR